LSARPWAFVKSWGVKYDKAVECLTKDRDALPAFSEFPAERWKHLPTIANWPGFSAGIMPE
jgi:transposase-like protein